MDLTETADRPVAPDGAAAPEHAITVLLADDNLIVREGVRALLGRAVTIGRERGKAIALESGGAGWVTVHPSYLLRIDDKARAEDEFGRFVEDLRAAQALLG